MTIFFWPERGFVPISSLEESRAPCRLSTPGTIPTSRTCSGFRAWCSAVRASWSPELPGRPG